MDWQSLVFRWAAFQAAGTGVILLAFGLLYAFFGFRFARFLLAASAAATGAFLGGTIAGPFGIIAVLTVLLPAASLFAVSLRYPQVGLVIASAATLGALGYYLPTQVGLPGELRWACTLAAAALGTAFAWLNPRGMPLVVTTFQGVGLMIVGFVGVSNAWLPSLGLTFLEWSAHRSLLVPMLFVMLSLTAFSFQANAHQGDIRSGA